VGGLHLTDQFRRHGAARAVLLQACDHLGLGSQKSLKKWADLVRLGRLLAGGLQRRTMLLGLVPQGQELLAGCSLLRWRPRHPTELRQGWPQRQDDKHRDQQQRPVERHRSPLAIRPD
jgi:hypothetical protein